MNLKYNYMIAQINYQEHRHAQEVMRALGITHTHSTPQTLGDQYWFWNCENVPDVLPPYITMLDLSPMECIGFGLSKEESETISAHMRVEHG